MPDTLKLLLHQIYIKPLAVQSNVARSDAALVAMAASMGLITTHINAQTFGRDWRITNRGLLLLKEED